MENHPSHMSGNPMMRLVSAFLFFCLLALPVRADVLERTITIKDHKFEPSTLEIPADQKVKLVIKNEDSSAEEFESHDLHREKVIPGHATGSVFVGPLKAGTYKFFGEFHPATAQGVLVVK